MKKCEMRNEDLFSFEHTLAAPLLKEYVYPWEVLAHIGDFITELGKTLPSDEYLNPSEGIWIHKTASIASTATLIAPVIIGPGTEVRPGAFVRGKALVGENCVVGNSTELKNVILSDNVQVPHYNYVGDSILGFHAHMGAGAITSNVRADRKPVIVHAEDEEIATGLKKIGAMLGDYAEIGCNSVMNPGTVIGKNTIVYPLSMVRGCVNAGSIYKGKDDIVAKRDDH